MEAGGLVRLTANEVAANGPLRGGGERSGVLLGWR